MAKVYREGRMKFLKEKPNASEIETVEAGIAYLLEALTVVVEAYDKENPARLADMHSADCDCMRCAIDNARAARDEVSRG